MITFFLENTNNYIVLDVWPRSHQLTKPPYETKEGPTRTQIEQWLEKPIENILIDI